jgi:predicted nucleic acid-binding protein
MPEIVLDANILVAQSDAHDALHAKAVDLVARLEREGHRPVLLDVLVAEAVSVLCRRARERKTNPPALSAFLEYFRIAAEAGEIRFVGTEAERLFSDILSVISATTGVLNFNDALLVVFQREGLIDDVASLDDGFKVVSDFRRLS